MPNVIKEKAYKKSYSKHVDRIKNDIAAAYLTKDNEQLRWDCLALIEPEIQKVEDHLAGMRKDKKYSIGGGGKATFAKQKEQGLKNGYILIKDWLADENRHALVGFFASTIAPFAANYLNMHALEKTKPLQQERNRLEKEEREKKAQKKELEQEKQDLEGKDDEESTSRRQEIDKELSTLESDLPKLDTKIKQKYREINEALDPKLTDEVKRDFGALSHDAVVKNAIAKRTEFFKENMTKMCKRLCDDWDDINELFFQGKVLKKLVDVKTTGADYHKCGKQVLILTFKVQPKRRKKFSIGFGSSKKNVYTREKSSPEKLVYKPSDVELDWRICGDTDVFKAGPLNNLLTAGDKRCKLSSKESLFCAINAKKPKVKFNEAGEEVPFRLPVYNILPRYPGSGLDPKGDALPITDSYGYLEFLTHDPDPGEGESSLDRISLAVQRAHDWDYVCPDPKDKEQAKYNLRNFYYTLGWYLALGMVLNFGDQHRENVIVHKRWPCLVDLEICFKHRANEIEATMLEYHFENDMSDKNLLLCLTSGDKKVHPTVGSEAKVYIKKGHDDALAWMKDNRDVVQGWLEDGEMKKVVTRYTPRPTMDFTRRMWMCHHPNFLTRKLPQQEADWKQEPYNGWRMDDLAMWHKHGGKGYPGRPRFALATAKHDYACYHNCDAPAYYRRLGSLDLLNARGEVVKVEEPGGPDKLAISLNEPEAIGVRDPTLGALLMGGMRAERVLAGADEKESIRFLATAQGDSGLRLAIHLKDNPGGDGDQAISGVVEKTEEDSALVVTFGRKGGKPEAPTLKELADFVNQLEGRKDLMEAELVSNDPGKEADGSTKAKEHDKVSLWAPNPELKIPGEHFFDYDPEGMEPKKAIEIALSRYKDVMDNKGGSVQSKAHGENHDQELKLSEVMSIFAELKTSKKKRWDGLKKEKQGLDGKDDEESVTRRQKIDEELSQLEKKLEDLYTNETSFGF